VATSFHDAPALAELYGHAARAPRSSFHGYSYSSFHGYSYSSFHGYSYSSFHGYSYSSFHRYSYSSFYGYSRSQVHPDSVDHDLRPFAKFIAGQLRGARVRRSRTSAPRKHTPRRRR